MKRVLWIVAFVVALCVSVLGQGNLGTGGKTYPPGEMTRTTVASLPTVGDVDRLWSVSDCADATCASGGGSIKAVLKWNGAAYAVVGGGSTPTTITVANEAADTTAFVAFFNSATGDLGPKTNAGLTFNAAAGVLGAVNLAPGFATTATAAGTTTLTVASKGVQAFTGSTTQTVTLPVVTTLPQTGFGFVIQNDSSGALTINSSGDNLVQTMAAGTRAFFTCKLLTGTTAASWNVTYISGGISGLTTNTVPKATSATTIGDSRITDDGSGDVKITFAEGGPNFAIHNDDAASDVFQLSASGKIVKYGDSAPADGQLLIGSTSGVIFQKATLSPGNGILITNGSGEITIAANQGSVLAIPVNNTVLATATGTVYSSPGYAGTPLTATTEGAVSFPSPRAGFLAALYVRTGTTVKVNTPATQVTVRINGVDTGLTIAVTQTVSTTSSITGSAIAVNAGDLITVSFVTTGAAAVSTSIAGVSILLN